jgi:hypothetical protein
MNPRVAVKGRSEDIALLKACYRGLGLEWEVEPWAERRTCARERAVGHEVSNRMRGSGKVIPFPTRRVS